MAIGGSPVDTGAGRHSPNNSPILYIEYNFYELRVPKSSTHQSMKTSDNDLKVNLNIYPDAVNVIGWV